MAAPYVIIPPLRIIADSSFLWLARFGGTLQTAGVIRCPFMLSKKPPVKLIFGKLLMAKLLHSNGWHYFFHGALQTRVTFQHFVSIISSKPAKIFNLIPRKGFIAPGYDADLVILNSRIENIISVINLHQHCDSNIFYGLKNADAPKSVLCREEVVS